MRYFIVGVCLLSSALAQVRFASSASQRSQPVVSQRQRTFRPPIGQQLVESDFVPIVPSTSPRPKIQFPVQQFIQQRPAQQQFIAQTPQVKLLTQRPQQTFQTRDITPFTDVTTNSLEATTVTTASPFVVSRGTQRPFVTTKRFQPPPRPTQPQFQEVQLQQRFPEVTQQRFPEVTHQRFPEVRTQQRFPEVRTQQRFPEVQQRLPVVRKKQRFPEVSTQQRFRRPGDTRGPPVVGEKEFEEEQELVEEDYEYEDEPDRLQTLLLSSNFHCDPKADGYYADEGLECEVFHYCQAGIKHSWLCPDGNIFHQINLICQPPSADNICKNSSDFHFVNNFLYQQIGNDSSNRPLYADRFYPDGYYPGSTLDSNIYFTAEPAREVVRQSVVPVVRQRVPFRQQPQQSSVRKDVQQQAAVRDKTFRQTFRETRPVRQPSIQRRRQPLAVVRPQSDPFPVTNVEPEIHFRGAPQADTIVLGGYQGNIDIEDLARKTQ